MKLRAPRSPVGRTLLAAFARCYWAELSGEILQKLSDWGSLLIDYD